MAPHNLADIIGKRFGSLTVVQQMPSGNHGKSRWECRCDCGNKRILYFQMLKEGKASTCAECRIAKYNRTTGDAPPPVVGAKWVPLTQDKWALVDELDIELISPYRWRADTKNHGGTYYAISTKSGGTRSFSMHRMIADAGSGQVVDHINGDGWDNRRSNLRVCSMSENGRNSKISNRNTTGYKGVSRADGTRFYAHIRLGTYATAEEAARAYDNAAVLIYGEFAKINFPEEHGRAHSAIAKAAAK